MIEEKDRYLIDTHILLWALSHPEKIRKHLLDIIKNPKDNSLFVSPVTAYEIAQKHRIGKLPEVTYLIENYYRSLIAADIIEIPLTSEHLLYAGKMEWDNRDPWDRIIAAQSYIENIPLISQDKRFGELDILQLVN